MLLIIFNKDPEFVLAAVSQNGLALQYASEELQGDRNIVLAAVSQDGLALLFASEELQGDRNIVLAAVNQNGIALEYAKFGLRRDKRNCSFSHSSKCRCISIISLNE